MILRNLRPEGSKEYVMPKGFAFNYITCANYTFEIYGWILFGVATQTVAAFLFIAAGSFPMSQWALGKHKRLRKVTSCYRNVHCIAQLLTRQMSKLMTHCLANLQMFDGKDGRAKYPRRWIVFPPLL